MTGGSQGLGLAVALELTRLGAHVSIVARNQERLDAALEELEVRPGWSGALASAHSRVTECAGG